MPRLSLPFVKSSAAARVMAPKSASASDEERLAQSGGKGQPHQSPAHWNVNEDEIFLKATEYKCWHYFNLSIKDLPAFDKCTYFGISEEDENTNIYKECQKLAVAAACDTQPLLFDSLGAFGDTDREGFSDLSAVSDQIDCALMIIQHDNASLYMSHYINQNCYKVIKASRHHLRRRYLSRPPGTSGHRPRVLGDEARNTKAYHRLLDFVFNCLAWWIVRTSERERFAAQYLGILARWSVKLKLIALDPVRWAEDSMVRAEDVLRRISNDQSSEDLIKIQIATDVPDCEKTTVIFPADRDNDYFYYLNSFNTRQDLMLMVRQVLDSLATQYPHGEHAALEVRTRLFRGVLDQRLRHFTIRSNGDIESSSEMTDLQRSLPALNLLLFNSKAIGHRSHNPHPVPTDMAEVKWLCATAGRDVDEDSFITTHVDHTVSVVVPLEIAGCAAKLRALDKYLTSFQEEREPDVLPSALSMTSDDFPGLFEVSVTTRRNYTEQPVRSKTGMSVLSPAKAPLMISSDVGHDYIPEKDMRQSESLLKQEAHRVLASYQAKAAEMQSWTVTQESVLVRTRMYSYVSLALAFGVIAGCIPLPFVLKDSLPGVDPFQIVTFSWLVAGAFLVGTKSRYVESWPWHDFLRGQIVCSSVSELADASRTDRQAVLLYLLHHEFRHTLQFSGPYHGVFQRQVSKGFNVDVPTSHATVLAAGFVVMETFENENMAWERHTVLHDTRESRDGEQMIFKQDEMSRELEGKRKLLRKKCDPDLRLIDNTVKIIGLSTMDCTFT